MNRHVKFLKPAYYSLGWQAEQLYVYAVGKLSPTTTSAFENVLPVTAVIFSFIFFGKMLTAVQIAGAIIILAAVTAIALIERR